MAKRVTEELDRIDVFTYDTDVLAATLATHSKPELLELAKLRKYKGLHKLNKLELAIIVADRLTAERDESRKLVDEVLDDVETSRAEVQAMIEKLADTSDAELRIRARSLNIDGAAEMTIPVLRNHVAAELVRQSYIKGPERAEVLAAELSSEFLKQQAEDEKAEAEIKEREEDEAAPVLEAGQRWRMKTHTGTVIELTSFSDSIYTGAPGWCITVVEHAFAATVGLQGWMTSKEIVAAYTQEPVTPEAEEEPVPLDTWLEPGMVLISPRDGERYRFERWTGGTAVLVNQENGALVRVAQYDVRNWRYLPKASAAGIEAAKIEARPRKGDTVKFLAGDARERTVKIVHSTDPYVLLNDHGNTWVKMDHLRVVRRAEELPRPAVGDRVRWTEDSREMFVREVKPTGAYVSPTADGHLSAFAAWEDLVPNTVEAWQAYADRVKESRDAAEHRVAELISECEELRATVHRYQQAMAYTAGKQRALATGVEKFVAENR